MLTVAGCSRDAYFQSCGVADLFATCTAGRNRLIAEAHVKTKKVVPCSLGLCRAGRMQTQNTTLLASRDVYELISFLCWRKVDFGMISKQYPLIGGKNPALMIVSKSVPSQEKPYIWDVPKTRSSL